MMRAAFDQIKSEQKRWNRFTFFENYPPLTTVMESEFSPLPAD